MRLASVSGSGAGAGARRRVETREEGEKYTTVGGEQRSREQGRGNVTSDSNIIVFCLLNSCKAR